MQSTLTIIDDILPDPIKVRSWALRLDYCQIAFHGHMYHGVSEAPVKSLYPYIESALGCEIEPTLSFFRLGMTGMPMTTFIHADQDCGEYAGVLYLNLPHQKYGGTAFWRHRLTQWAELPENCDIDHRRLLAFDGHDESFWTQEMFVPMKFNRFITYPTKMFHSRYPNNIEAATKEDGRLVYAVFYNRK